MTKKRLAAWLLAAFTGLSLHYLLLVIGCLITKGDLSPASFLALMTERLTQPGDAVRYLDIAENGYVTEGENAINLVFYPLYPFLVRLLSLGTGRYALAGVALSHLCFAGACAMLYELLRLDGGPREAFGGVLLMSAWPFSMFVLGVYSESLFLLLSIGCLYCMRRDRMPAAGICGFLAALTRVQGMLLIFPLVYAAVRRVCREKRFRGRDVCALLPIGGFLVYLAVNYALHGDPFKFLEFEAGEPWYQTTQWVGQTLADQASMVGEYPGLAPYIYWPQLILFFFSALVLLTGLRQKAPVEYVLYGAVYLGFTYLSGWMISGGRYLLGCVPLFLILARVRTPAVRYALFTLEGMLFFFYNLLFLMAYAIM